MKNKYRICIDVVNKPSGYINFGLLLLTVVVLVLIPVSATPQYVSTLKNVYDNGSCETCHVNSSGGGERNAYGTLFEKQISHVSSPSAALLAIGSPSNARNTTVISTPNVTTGVPTATLTSGPTETVTQPTVAIPQQTKTVADVANTPVSVPTNKSPGIGTVVIISIMGTIYIIRKRK